MNAVFVLYHSLSYLFKIIFIETSKTEETSIQHVNVRLEGAVQTHVE